MKRRLFYLLPDKRQAGKLAVELEHVAAIQARDIHAVAQDVIEIQGVADVHAMNAPDHDAAIEWWGWRINLTVFVIAFLAFGAVLLWSPSWWLIVPIAVMAGTLVAGLVFALQIPAVHINEFKPAMRHGEILMMVDLKPSQVNAVSRYVRRQHPAAIAGGLGWHM